jgi:homoserine kinase
MALSLHLEVGLVDESEPPPADRRVIADEHHPAAVAFRRGGGEGRLWVSTVIPMGRGLGFSGAARVGGLVAAHAQRDGHDLDVGERAIEILTDAADLEGHADNVAASLHGGIVATDGRHAVRVPLPFDPAVVVWIPPDKTSTDESRARLAPTVSFEDAIFNVARTAVLVAALAAGDIAALRDATADRLHQDVRFASAPASRAALDSMLAAGAWCGWLSGSGPTVAALCAADHADGVAAALPEGGAAKVLRIDHAGAVIEAG